MRILAFVVCAAIVGLGACGGSAVDTTGPSGARNETNDGSPSSPSNSGSSSPTPRPNTQDGGTSASTDGAAPPVSTGSQLACNMTPPAGAPQADPLPTYAGTCPTLSPAPAENTITSSGAARKFMMAVPSNVKPDEPLPVIFMWHWLGGSASGFYSQAEVQNAVDTQRFIAVLPEAKGDVLYKWPFSIEDSDARMEEEFGFFDDMLACVAAQFKTVNKNCVSSVGVSAGALFTDQLASGRANRLASFMSLSGGVGGIIRGWGNPAHKLPGIVLWGGPNDQCEQVLNFQQESQSLESALSQQGNFVIECEHNCGHSAPPFDAPAGLSKFAGLWDFVFDHPFWLGAGESPYKTHGLPNGMPSWCAIGAGNATPRTGACTSQSGC